MVAYGVHSVVNKGKYIFIDCDFFLLCNNAVSCQWMNEHGALVEWYWQENWSAHRNTWVPLCLPHVPHWLLQWEAGSWLPKPWHIFVSCKHTVHLVCMYENWSWTGGMGQQGLDLSGSVKDQWQANLNVVIHLWVLWDVGYFLTVFTKGSLLPGMSRRVGRSISWLQNSEWKAINRKDKLDKVGLP